MQNAGNTAWPFNLSKNQSAKVILKYAMLLLKLTNFSNLMKDRVVLMDYN